MTREEAIRILAPETTGEALAEIEYYNGFNGKIAAALAMADACVMAVAALREQKKQRWIPVEDQLPEADGTYLCVWQGRKVDTGFFVNGQFRLYGEVKTHLITHWMPLPEPPKEDDNEICIYQH